MRAQDAKLLQCIECENPLELFPEEVEQGEVVSGLLRCRVCNAEYPIINKTGVFFKRDEWKNYLTSDELAELARFGYDQFLTGKNSQESGKNDPQAKVASNWEYQWREAYAWSSADLESSNMFNEKFFWDFIPLEPESLKGKRVYIACGGRGREAYHAAKQNPALIIVAEIGAEIYDINKLGIQEQAPLLLLRCDVSHCPLRSEVADVSICDHALQHVKDHSHGFAELVKATKVGGLVGICVYSHENNFLMTKIVEPLKKIIHCLPLKIIRALSLLPAIVIYLAIHLFYIPLNNVAPRVARRLPLNDHMLFWSQNPIAIVWLSCFDLLHAPISYHFRRDEVDKLAVDNSCEINKVILTNGTTWSLICKKIKKLGTL